MKKLKLFAICTVIGVAAGAVFWSLLDLIMDEDEYEEEGKDQ